MNSSSTSTSFFGKNGLEGEVMGLRTTNFAFIGNIGISWLGVVLIC